MIIQTDCHIGQGFEHLDEAVLGNMTMYFLTRHETPGNVGFCSHAIEMCGPKSRYQGSHNANLFRLLVPGPSQLLDKVDYRSNINGIMIASSDVYFRTYRRYKVKNPCKILHIIHHHCVKSETDSSNNYFHGDERIDDHLNLSVGHQGDKVLAPFSCL